MDSRYKLAGQDGTKRTRRSSLLQVSFTHILDPLTDNISNAILLILISLTFQINLAITGTVMPLESLPRKEVVSPDEHLSGFYIRKCSTLN